MRGILAIVCLLSAGGLNGPADVNHPTTATGVVFHDADRDGVRGAGEAGLPGVCVSNGRDVVVTDEDGVYRLPVDDDTIIFVIKPRGWMTPVDKLNLPRFYYIHKPEGSPKLKYPGVAPTGPLPASVDFPLHRQNEPNRFRVLVFGDTQPHSVEEIDYLCHDVIEEVIGIDAAFGISLGDLVSDRLELFPPQNRAIAHVGCPFYNVLGNHDMNYHSPNDKYSDETFERVYGPSYYSFDYGPLHFVVLDSVVWHGKTEERKGYYRAGLGERQMGFLRNDLALVPKDRLVVLTMHIPIVELKERAELFGLLAKHPHTLSFSAHTHINQNLLLDEEHDWPGERPHHHINFGTTCGSWWKGAPDELGLPHATMADGSPNGWFIVTFEGVDYSVGFKAARRPADYQMNIYAPLSVPAERAGETEVLVNFFTGSQRSTVEMRFDAGPWVRLKRRPREDPYFVAIKQAEESEHPPRGGKLPKAVKCPHMWLGTLPADPPPGTHLIEVRATDMFGQTHVGRRMIRIEPPSSQVGLNRSHASWDMTPRVASQSGRGGRN